LIAPVRSQKEPKLACTRQIPERGLYDGEIARFTRKLADEGRIHASAAAADVNELSKAGSFPLPVPEEEATQGNETGEDEGGVSAGHIRDEL
jgi:UDP-glucose:glycoprotein glucosyltransferase